MYIVGVGSQADQHRTEKAMGKGSEWIAASEDCDGLGSCKADHVGIRPQEDRGGAAGGGEVEHTAAGSHSRPMETAQNV
jgi:hypothetical protein